MVQKYNATIEAGSHLSLVHGELTLQPTVDY